MGRQLGIAAENISALDDILRHTENLQFIFEGIADPLLLLNSQGSAVIINEAARLLTKDLFARTEATKATGICFCCFARSNQKITTAA